MGRGQNININRSLGEAVSNPQGWLWGVQEFNIGSNCRCADVVEIAGELELEVNVVSWSCYWIAAASSERTDFNF